MFSARKRTFCCSWIYNFDLPIWNFTLSGFNTKLDYIIFIDLRLLICEERLNPFHKFIFCILHKHLICHISQHKKIKSSKIKSLFFMYCMKLNQEGNKNFLKFLLNNFLVGNIRKLKKQCTK